MLEIFNFTFMCAVSVILLWCMGRFLYHAYCKGDWLAAVLETEWQYSYTFITRIYLSLAALGFLAYVGCGTYVLLWWMPSNWGGLDEDGNFASVRYNLAGASTFFLGFPLIGLILRGISNTARTKSLETRLHAAETSAAELSKQLETHKEIVESLREQVESLRSKSDR